MQIANCKSGPPVQGIANRKWLMWKWVCLLVGLNLWIVADVILAPVQGDSEAIKFHLWASQGTNEFVEVATVGTNSYFQITNRMTGRWRFYVVSEDEEGNLSERSNYLVIKPQLKKPALVLHETGGGSGGASPYPTRLGGATREQLQVLSGPNYKPFERKLVELPPPPLP